MVGCLDLSTKEGFSKFKKFLNLKIEDIVQRLLQHMDYTYIM